MYIACIYSLLCDIYYYYYSVVFYIFKKCSEFLKLMWKFSCILKFVYKSFNFYLVVYFIYLFIYNYYYL